MTEQEWLACTDPRPMLEHLRGKASERKLRLFAVACCRLRWDLLIDDRSRKAVEVVEGLADGAMEKLEATVQAAWRAVCDFPTGFSEKHVHEAIWAAYAVAFDCSRRESIHRLLLGLSGGDGSWNKLAAPRKGDHCVLLRDIFGNPFRPVPFDRLWLTRTVHHLAQTIYQEKAFDRLPILGDAVEDAGCTSQAVLDHFRSKGLHVRGCWPLDLILGKE